MLTSTSDLGTRRSRTCGGRRDQVAAGKGRCLQGWRAGHGGEAGLAALAEKKKQQQVAASREKAKATLVAKKRKTVIKLKPA